MSDFKYGDKLRINTDKGAEVLGSIRRQEYKYIRVSSGSETIGIPNSKENYDSMIKDLMIEYSFPIILNCSYQEEIGVLLDKYCLVNRLNFEYNFCYFSFPYVESSELHISVEYNSESRLLRVLKILEEENVSSRIIMDLIRNAE